MLVSKIVIESIRTAIIANFRAPKSIRKTNLVVITSFENLHNLIFFFFCFSEATIQRRTSHPLPEFADYRIGIRSRDHSSIFGSSVSRVHRQSGFTRYQRNINEYFGRHESSLRPSRTQNVRQTNFGKPRIFYL